MYHRLYVDLDNELMITIKLSGPSLFMSFHGSNKNTDMIASPGPVVFPQNFPGIQSITKNYIS